MQQTDHRDVGADQHHYYYHSQTHLSMQWQNT